MLTMYLAVIKIALPTDAGKQQCDIFRKEVQTFFSYVRTVSLNIGIMQSMQLFRFICGSPHI